VPGPPPAGPSTIGCGARWSQLQHFHATLRRQAKPLRGAAESLVVITFARSVCVFLISGCEASLRFASRYRCASYSTAPSTVQYIQSCSLSPPGAPPGIRTAGAVYGCHGVVVPTERHRVQTRAGTKVRNDLDDIAFLLPQSIQGCSTFAIVSLFVQSRARLGSCRAQPSQGCRPPMTAGSTA
jgi:hypothetical protein